MPQLAPLVPVVAGGGAATTGGGATVATGITAGQVLLTGAVVVSAVTVGVLVDDYLDTPVAESETEAIQTQAGDQSRADRDALRDCADCIWCQINIQAQGDLLWGRGNRPATQGIGPYLVQGRTVFAREGVIVAGLTHEFVEGIAGRSVLRSIRQWNILATTIRYIQSRPPGGLPPGYEDYRPGSLDRYARQVRYDIAVQGTINAFME